MDQRAPAMNTATAITLGPDRGWYANGTPRLVDLELFEEESRTRCAPMATVASSATCPESQTLARMYESARTFQRGGAPRYLTLTCRRACHLVVHEHVRQRAALVLG
jgi:hypothetical protein